ncbi:ferritin-like domain-containing protein [Geoalkalibacter halelectricus]|uniref:Ferritin family protein n=1 Tax=Geoalkalibacter halelectricus TaxID=2847045 RepID=A0ABY5ZKE3_9BACT|nr:ferritin family protein [Geoalkalibacter halelectricus]MDO3380146.1 ferritin family protein [Geoalkalibacter halelectricus]UWZ78280.1 ferritin family protein [Geoalkalibacter halelectricus]
MAEKINVQEAVKRSIMTEKNAMYFYSIGAEKMKNTEAKKFFELLAREEREHAGQFFKIYKGGDIPDFEKFINTPPSMGEDWLSELDKSLLAGFNERKAMELAMDKELKLEKSLRDMAARIDDPAVKAVYEANAKSTHHHYELIESEYARLMGMVHETDIDTYVRE